MESWRYLLLFCGVLLCLACKGWRGRCVGEAVFGFGLLFEGVTVMRSAMEPLLQSPLLRLELARVQQSPLHGLLTGVCMTLTVQSSSATVALLQSMAAQPGADGVHSLLGLTAAIPILQQCAAHRRAAQVEDGVGCRHPLGVSSLPDGGKHCRNGGADVIPQQTDTII